uniref:Uncharacterized protein n=1 Tax=Panagrolaimus sp. JU765 TaxID=591449 RepID=A0AC34QTE0_9BILA
LISNKSPIYVITDGIPADNHLAEDVNVLNSYYQAPINFIYIEPSASSQCPLFDTQSPGFRPIIETSFRFSGIASFVSAVNRGSTGELIYQHMTNTYHKAHLMFSDDQRDCANLPRYIPLSIDAKFHRLAVIAEGVNATLQLNQPDGTVSNFSDTFTLGYVNMLGKNGLQIGTWTLSVINQSIRTGCSIRVYAVEDPTPGTNGQDYHMVFGITPSLTQDAPEVQPIIGFKQSIVAHIEN